MSDKEIAFLQSIGEKLILFCANQRVENKERLKNFKVVYVNREPSGEDNQNKET